MNKKVCITAFAICSLFTCFLTGCLSSEERELAKQYEIQASQNAMEYISNKYDFDSVAIKESEAVITSDASGMGSTITGYVFVTLQCDGETIKVYIDGQTANTDGADDYQTEAIFQDIKQKAGDILQREIVDAEISAGVTGQYFSEYYDGDLSDVISENDRIILSCINQTAAESDMIALKNVLCAEQIMLLNFSSEAGLEAATADIWDIKSITNNFQLEADDVLRYLIYMEDYAILANDDCRYYTIQRTDCQNLSVIGVGAAPFELNATASDMDFCFETYYDHYELLGNTCHIESNAEYLVIFCKRDQIPQTENDVEFAIKEQHEDYRTQTPISLETKRVYDIYSFEGNSGICMDVAYVQQVDS